MLKIRRSISALNMHPEMAEELFNVKWRKPVTGYRIIKRLCKLKSTGIKKMFKELPILECEDYHAKALNYLILALTAYKATADVIYNRFVNIALVCQGFQTRAQVQKIQKMQLESSSGIQFA